MHELIGIPITTLAPSALVGVAVLLVLTGRLVPRRTYDDKTHEANEWRTEARIKDQQIVVKDEQIAAKDRQLSHMAEVGETVRSVLASLQELSRRGGAQ